MAWYNFGKSKAPVVEVEQRVSIRSRAIPYKKCVAALKKALPHLTDEEVEAAMEIWGSGNSIKLRTVSGVVFDKDIFATHGNNMLGVISNPPCTCGNEVCGSCIPYIQKTSVFSETNAGIIPESDKRRLLLKGEHGNYKEKK